MKRELPLTQRIFLALNTFKHDVVGNSICICILGIISIITYLSQGLLNNDVTLKIFSIIAFILCVGMLLLITIDIVILMLACYIKRRGK